MNRPQRKLIINADDAGIDISRNKGIFRALKDGVVSSISAVVSRAGWEDLKRQLKEVPFEGVGIHFNLTAGRPLVDGLQTITTPDGNFHDKFMLLSLALGGKIDLQEVKRELGAQLEVFLELGLYPSHYDGHNHIHLLPGVREVITEIVPSHAWVRLPFERHASIQPAKKEESPRQLYDEKGRLITFLNSLSMEAKGLWGDSFRYVDDFAGTQLTPNPTLEGFKEMVSLLQGKICEIVCHPGDYPDETAVRFSCLPARIVETEILTSLQLRHFLEEQSFQIANFNQL